MVAFDITNTEPFNNLKFWINSIKTNMENKNISIPVIIIGNKTDMEESREIMTEDAEKFAEDNKYKYFETSAKTGEGIDKAIRDLINQILNQSGNNDDQKEYRKDSVKIKENTEENWEKKKKGCC